MSQVKLLADQIDTQITGDERRAIYALRSLIPRLTKRETLALVIFLIEASITIPTTIGKLVGITALQSFTVDFANTVLQIPALSLTNKLAIAIELLVAQIEGKKEDGEKE